MYFSFDIFLFFTSADDIFTVNGTGEEGEGKERIIREKRVSSIPTTGRVIRAEKQSVEPPPDATKRWIDVHA